MTERKIVIPGEVLSEEKKTLPGEGTERRDEKIVSLKYGLAEESDGLIKVIPLSGIYNPRKGNVVIGKVENVTFNGWIINIGFVENAFLMLSEVPRFVSKYNMDEVLEMGDMVIAKISDVNKRGVDLTIKGRGFGKIEEGIIIEINSNKVPRIIGKEGSMIKLIKDETGCDITVGQNGLIWISGENMENELLAKRAINFITEKSHFEGLTDEVKKFFKEEKKGGKK